MKFGFAGDRGIAKDVLRFIINQGYQPEILMIPELSKSSHGSELIELTGLPRDRVIMGRALNDSSTIELLRSLELDYIFGVHFPFIIKKEILEIPSIGFLNLHPAYLPYNKGWHTPSWAILDKTPYGATLHYMAEKLDAGDIIHQKELKIRPDHTANKLYQEVLRLEFEVFQEAWPRILNKKLKSFSPSGKGTSHRKQDLLKHEVQQIDLNNRTKAEVLLNQLRALTTNRWHEAAFFDKDGKRYRVQIDIKEEDQE